VRGEFNDDFERPRAALFPSERGGPADKEAFRLGVKDAAARHLRGPVRALTPHVLRHACASRLYADGLSLLAVQQVLGHRWLTTTVSYVHVANEVVEAEYARAAERAAARLSAPLKNREGSR
jgi:site-specific recombinase XerD